MNFCTANASLLRFLFYKYPIRLIKPYQKNLHDNHFLSKNSKQSYLKNLHRHKPFRNEGTTIHRCIYRDKILEHKHGAGKGSKGVPKSRRGERLSKQHKEQVRKRHKGQGFYFHL